MPGLITPFEYTICNVPSLKSVPAQEYNFEPVDLFSLKSQLLPILRDLYGPVELLFKPEIFEDHMRLMAYTSPDRILDVDISFLQETIMNFVQNFSKKAILIDMAQSLTGEIFLPNWFIQEFLPRIKVKNTFFDGDFLYLDLSKYLPINDVYLSDNLNFDPVARTGNLVYQDAYTNVLNDIVTTLENLWLSGFRTYFQTGLSKPEKAYIFLGSPFDIDLTDVYIFYDEVTTSQNLSVDTISTNLPLKTITS